MELPNADRAYVEDVRRTGCLLDIAHPQRDPKARFLLAHGFRSDAPGMLRADLLAHARTNAIAGTRATPHAPRYTVKGPLVAPDSFVRTTRMVWQVDNCSDFPRLMAAHPVDEGGCEMHEPQRFDSASLVVALPEEPCAESVPPSDWHGLQSGERGAVVDVYEEPPGYTVEFFRDGKTIAWRM